MTSRPECPRCGYKMKSLYQRVGDDATYKKLDDWFYCKRDNWMVNPHDTKIMQEIIEATDPQFRKVKVDTLNDNQIREKLMAPFVKNKQELVAYIEHAEVIVDVVLNAEDDDVRLLALSKLDPDKFDQTLEYVALNDNSPFLRLHTANLMKRDNIFEILALSDEEEFIRRLMLNRLDNIRVIKEMALNDAEWKIRHDALRKLILLKEENDNVELEDTASKIIENETTYEIQVLALSQISDENTLKSLVSKENDKRLNWRILEKIEDEDFLMECYQNDNIPGRGGAIHGIDDQNLLMNIAKSTDDGDIFEAAITNLEETTFLREIATKDDLGYYFVEGRTLAALKVGDKDLIWNLIQTDPELDLRIVLCYTIDDIEKLEAIVFSEMPVPLRIVAISQINEKDIILRAAKTANHVDIRSAAIKKINNVKQLLDVYDHLGGEQNAVLRRQVIEKLSNETQIRNLFEGETNELVKIAAIEKLSDKQYLSQISVQDVSDKVRLAAENRLARVSRIQSDDPLIRGNQEFIRKMKHLGVELDEKMFQPGPYKKTATDLTTCPNCEFIVGDNRTCTNCGQLMKTFSEHNNND